MPKTTRVWYSADLHGSDHCFQKFLHLTVSDLNLDVLILGGDLTGKIIVPIIKTGSTQWIAHFEGSEHEFRSAGEVTEFRNRLAATGIYSYECDPETACHFQFEKSFQDEVVADLRKQRLLRWIELADEFLRSNNRLVLVTPGSDDPSWVDDIVRQSNSLTFADGSITEIAQDLAVASFSYSCPKPWPSPRAIPESLLHTKLEALTSQRRDMSNVIFNFHCPPRRTLLDRAPALTPRLRQRIGLGGRNFEHVGSSTIRTAIEIFQPPASLHGLVHEQHCHDSIGRTVCLNPGTEYRTGSLSGAYLEFSGKTLKEYALTRENLYPFARQTVTRLTKYSAAVLNTVARPIGDIITVEAQLAKEQTTSSRVPEDIRKQLAVISSHLGEIDQKILALDRRLETASPRATDAPDTDFANLGD